MEVRVPLEATGGEAWVFEKWETEKWFGKNLRILWERTKSIAERVQIMLKDKLIEEEWLFYYVGPGIDGISEAQSGRLKKRISFKETGSKCSRRPQIDKARR
jgi:hypothetical protein